MVATLDSEGEVASGSDSESAHAVFPRTAVKEPRTKVLQRMPPGKEPRTKVLQQMPPTIQVLGPRLLDELATKAPTNFDGLALAKVSAVTPVLERTHDSYCNDLDTRFDPIKCRLATADEVAPFAPRVCVEGDPHGTNLHCGPMELYLLRDLKSEFHGFSVTI